MRFLLPVVLGILLLGACSKNRRMTKHVEGRWLLTRILNNDGSNSYPNEVHEFGASEPGGKTYAGWIQYSSDFSDTVTGSYRISKKGTNMYFRNDEQVPVTEEEAVVDDFDKNTLIVRRESGVYFYEKQ